MAWGIGLTFIRALKSLRNYALMGSICPEHMFSQKISEELCIMTLKGDAKFKGKLICGLKKDTRNLVNFNASSRKSENLNFDRILLSKAYKDLEGKNRRGSLLTLKSDAKFEEKLTLGSRNDMRHLVNLNVSSGKSENFHFDRLLL